VLLLEDDPAVRLFVQMALEPLSVDVQPCATLAEARQALADPSVQLVITDLTLPDGSGLDLLQWLDQRARSGGVRCRTVVFSGGIDTAMKQKLQALQVWRVLRKPASVGSLMACVSEALAADASAEQLALEVPRNDPVAEFFGGNRPLYDAYRTACLLQLPKDLGDGDLAARTGDAQALRRVAHNLKSVLAMLGEAPAARQARDTEEAAAAGAAESMRHGWQQLRGQVQALLATGHAPG
jgi:CheY-like chemotaxis protein